MHCPKPRRKLKQPGACYIKWTNFLGVKVDLQLLKPTSERIAEFERRQEETRQEATQTKLRAKEMTSLRRKKGPRNTTNTRTTKVGISPSPSTRRVKPLACLINRF
mmetsp:Transcript_3751/g.6930  ORF Transcript_3751/g.6930 Transcript_3751/m.6930 type:complete len:106 (-) Transcript_3751:180-497(-)